jgi:hypothetical protein
MRFSPEQTRYENHEPWDKDVPADLIPAIKHLRKSFEDAHWGAGRTTEFFCYYLLHDQSFDDPRKEYQNYLTYMKVRVGKTATQHFIDLAKEGTPPAIFKAFLDLYLEVMTVQILLIFKELLEIGLAQERRLGTPCLEWAEYQTQHLIRSQIHLVRMWVRNVCDKQVYEPNEDQEEQIFWRKWQAPMFLTMNPSLHQPYNDTMIWERKDAESSLRLLNHFAEHYVVHLETKVKRAAGEAALESAKKRKPMEKDSQLVSLPQNGLPDLASAAPHHSDRAPAEGHQASSSARREVRKLDTQNIHHSWQKEYRKLRKSHPGHSDVWYSQKIAKMDISTGRSAETIRKHMTK